MDIVDANSCIVKRMTAKSRIDRADIGRRLRLERDRLGLSQGDLATEGEISQRTQAAWEKGEQTPTADYLARVAQSGIDVLYVLTATRALPSNVLEPGAVDVLMLDLDEVVLLNCYRKANDQSRQVAKSMLEVLAALSDRRD